MLSKDHLKFTIVDPYFVEEGFGVDDIEDHANS
jgi:hypothetical protein